ncbi:MAG: DUF2163 domain-containing protein [Parvibaculum sp.]|uniref:DUF2163 domain-containing protein n=1 Tax=Parvibaculum sp. TaxID=2024848 RepID=UPI0025D9D37D|nr:DUF2163 domain-containing protein [Parvibaculum sp.]MCE9650568.1 DUF2163 domain-containing protein [Parvibaculum sp.]
MKSLPPGLQSHLDGGATTLCNCWKLARTDGTQMGFTDHDRDLAFDGLNFEAAAGFTASAVESSSGLAVDNLDVLGALVSGRLGEADLAAGLFDDAEVEIWRVNWQAPDQRVLMRKGNLGEVSRGATGFSAELRGLAHRLNQPVGRLYQYACDADLGDARCGFAAEASSGTVTGCEDGRVLTATGLGGFAEGWFARGRLRFTGGANEGASMEVKMHTPSPGGATVELWQAMPRAVSNGDTFEVTPGCDKQFATCRARFSNAVNFRGFPHMPGNDFVMSYPASGDANDGASRS